MAFTFGQLFNSGAPGGGLGNGKPMTKKEEKQMRKAFEKADMTSKSKGADKKEKHSVVSVRAVRPEIKTKHPFTAEVSEDYDISEEVPSGSYIHEGNFKPKKHKEEKYTRSEEYRAHLKESNVKEPEAKTKARIHALDKLLEAKDELEVNDDIPDKPQSIPEKKDSVIKEGNEGIGLSAEDRKLQKDIYDLANFWGRILSKDVDDETKKERSKRELQDFNLSPYGWMKVALTNTLYKYKSKLEELRGEKERKEIEEKIAQNKTHLENLDRAYEKGIPLKLIREFTKNSIKLDDGRVFDVTKSLDYINKITNKSNKKYEIAGVFQRKNEELIDLRSETGERVNLKTGTLKGILDEINIKENPPIVKQEPASVKKEIPTEQESSLLDKVATLDEELGFINALVIERYLRVSKEEAKKLFNKYDASKKTTEPSTESVAAAVEATEPELAVVENIEVAEPIETDDTVTQEPAQEQQGPTLEQIAEFESIIKRREELDAQIKALEEEIQKELEGTQSIVATSLEATNNS